MDSTRVYISVHYLDSLTLWHPPAEWPLHGRQWLWQCSWWTGLDSAAVARSETITCQYPKKERPHCPSRWGRMLYVHKHTNYYMYYLTSKNVRIKSGVYWLGFVQWGGEREALEYPQQYSNQLSPCNNWSWSITMYISPLELRKKKKMPHYYIHITITVHKV